MRLILCGEITEETLKKHTPELKLETPIVQAMLLKTRGITDNGTVRLYAKISVFYSGVINVDLYANATTLPNVLASMRCKKTPPAHVEILSMNNNSLDDTHIGKALHEVAFRLYAEKNRITLTETHNLHYFHYQNGFRLLLGPSMTMDLGIKYYLNLAQALLEANGKEIKSKLMSCSLYLPLRQVKIKKDMLELSFTLSKEASSALAETREQSNLCSIGEYIITRVEDCLKKGTLSLQNRTKLLNDIQNNVTRALKLQSDAQTYKILCQSNLYKQPTDLPKEQGSISDLAICERSGNNRPMLS